MDLAAYDHLLVHGVLPLTRDIETGSIRFARLGIDRPEDCIGTPADLPEAKLTLHVFPDGTFLGGWLTAARRFGGNTIEIVTPAQYQAAAIALEIDHAGSRQQGNTFDEVVELLIDPQVNATELRKRIERGRADHLERNRLDLGRKAWEDSWSAERAVLQANRHQVRHVSYFDRLGPDSPLEYEVGSDLVRDRFELVRIERGYRICWSAFVHRYDDDLQGRLDALKSSLGIERHGDSLSIQVAEFSEEAVQRAVAADDAVHGIEKTLQHQQSLRQHVRDALTNDKMMAVLRKARAGAPIATGSLGAPGHQINPRTGSIQSVPATHTSKAFADGWLQVGYPGDDYRSPFPSRSRLPIVLTLSPAGKALCDGDEASASALVDGYRDADRRKQLATTEHGDPAGTLLAASDWLEDTARSALATVVAARIPEEYRARDILRGDYPSSAGWALLAAGIVAGVVEMDEARKPTIVQAASAPTP